MGLLNYTLLGIDNLAWPAIALGYPLIASIRAVGTDSKHHMRKLVMYWTVFSLLSLTEFAFVKIIEWIPYWSCVRFAVIYWLVIPEFEGACLVTPALLLKLQQLIDFYRKLKEERLSKREAILDAIQKYVAENGFEALENLVALKQESRDCIDYKRDIEVIEVKAEGENTAETSKEVRHERSICSSSQVLNGTFSIANANEITPEVSIDNRLPQIPPVEKTQQEWTCDLCNITTTSMSMMDAHLRGSNHKSKLESLRATLLDDQDSRMSIPSTTPPLMKADEHEWRCDLCMVKVTSEKTLIAHLAGKSHKSNASRMKIKEGVPWCSICDVKLLGSESAALHFKGKRHKCRASRIKIKDGVQWCTICDAKLLNSVIAASHFKGKQHSSKELRAMTC